MRDCADACAAAAALISRDSDYAPDLCSLCADDCERPADGDEIMERGAEACCSCAQSCCEMARD